MILHSITWDEQALGFQCQGLDSHWHQHNSHRKQTRNNKDNGNLYHTCRMGLRPLLSEVKLQDKEEVCKRLKIVKK
jgi:hypothetical protein